MDNFSEKLQKALQANQKNINDLIGQELNLLLFAQFLSERPELEDSVEIIFHEIYVTTCRTILELWNELAENEEYDHQTFKQEVQLFVHQMIEDKKYRLEEKLNWVRRHKIT